MMYCSAMSVPGMRKFVLCRAPCERDVSIQYQDAGFRERNMPFGGGASRRSSRALESVEIGKYAANSERSGLGRTDPTQIIIISHPMRGPVSDARQ